MSRRTVIARVALLLPAVAAAGPPFLTDDPEPTATGHWELYAPLLEAEGRGDDFAGTSGAEFNYGAARDLQLSASVPAAYSHAAAGWRWGAGDLELSAKYRFHHDEEAGLQIAFFPGLTLPTASRGMGTGKVTGVLPLWAQKDIGHWSVFGGGGYAINPGEGKRDYWTAGVAVTRDFGERLLIGMEVDRRGPDTVPGHPSTSLGLGAIYDLPGPLRLLASGGPTYGAGDPPRFHVFVALGLELPISRASRPRLPASS